MDKNKFLKQTIENLCDLYQKFNLDDKGKCIFSIKAVNNNQLFCEIWIDKMLVFIRLNLLSIHSTHPNIFG